MAGVLGATLLSTWVLMVLGALRRASMAGMARPDWPLCHGYLAPPLQAAAYPQDPNCLVHKVYLEFLHRVVAAGVGLGALLVGLKAWWSGAHVLAVALGAVLGLQIAMGAVTVWVQNAPSTVVLHLVLALCFLGGLNGWLRIPPWASASHLGLAVVLFAVAAPRVAAGSAPPLGQDRAAPRGTVAS